MKRTLPLCLLIASVGIAAPRGGVAQVAASASELVRRGEEAIRDSSWLRAIVLLDSAAIAAGRDSAMLDQARYYGGLARYMVAEGEFRRAEREHSCNAAREVVRLLAEVDSLRRLVRKRDGVISDPLPGDPREPGLQLVRRYCR
jgi:hypothetical protein